jgi:hypothetical protein
MVPKKSQRETRNESTLPFDITQEIDPALVDEVLRRGEQTLNQVDFDDITVVLPENRKPRG